MQNLKVTVIQYDILWQRIRDNLKHVESLIKGISGSTDLIILPEMFNTGFTMKPDEVSEPMDGETVSFLKNMSRDTGCDVTGSLPVSENDRYYNRLVWAKPDGRIYTYDKRHLFRMAGEEKVYAPGSSHLTVELNGWRIRPFIC